MATILVTGSAGFIGFHTSMALLQRGDWVLGVDNLNDYYNPLLKRARLEAISQAYPEQFTFDQMDIVGQSIETLFSRNHIDRVIHLAAQAGVRYSLVNPTAYTHSNVNGFINILSLCQKYNIPLIYASTSSVYGGLDTVPFREDMILPEAKNYYAMTKRQNEQIAAMQSKIPTTGLRFFTVYGDYGRPDMFFTKFLNAKRHGERIEVFRNGRAYRDFTHVDDIVRGIMLASQYIGGNRIYNLAFGESRSLKDAVDLLDNGQRYSKIEWHEELPSCDIERTWADISKARTELGYVPKITLEDGISRLLSWYNREAL